MKRPEKPRPDDLLLDVKLLRFFDVLYSTRRLARAAEQLGQSAPTVSIWLTQLREALKDPLFVRTASGMLPTPRADALLPTVQEALRALRALSSEPRPFEPEHADRVIRI
jgi:DNA-binding transcriptional LysR family regulator